MTLIHFMNNKGVPSDEAAPFVNPLTAIEPFLAMLGTMEWFTRLGEPLNSEQRCLAVDYLAAIGFSECSPLYIQSWEEAEDYCLSIDGESAWRQEEARLMEVLTEDALDALEGDRATLQQLLTEMTAALSRILPIRLRQAPEADEQDSSLLDAAVGSAIHATQMAALMLLARDFDTLEALPHPAALRFQLFELGHWPIGVVGRSFVVF